MKPRIRAIPTFHHEDGRRLEFWPVTNTPGWTHRVILNGVAVDWLGATHPTSAKTARFYFDKHAPVIPPETPR